MEAGEAGNQDGAALEVLDAAGDVVDADADGLSGGMCQCGMGLAL